MRAHAELPAQDVVPLYHVGQLDDGARPHAHAVAGDGVPVPSVAEPRRERVDDARDHSFIDDVRGAAEHRVGREGRARQRGERGDVGACVVVWSLSLLSFAANDRSLAHV